MSPRSVVAIIRPVLHVPRLIEPVLRPDVLLDGRRQPAFGRVEIAGSKPDQPPGQRHDDEDHRDRDEQPAKNEADHEAGELFMSGMP